MLRKVEICEANNSNDQNNWPPRDNSDSANADSSFKSGFAAHSASAARGASLMAIWAATGNDGEVVVQLLLNVTRQGLCTH